MSTKSFKNYVVKERKNLTSRYEKKFITIYGSARHIPEVSEYLKDIIRSELNKFSKLKSLNDRCRILLNMNHEEFDPEAAINYVGKSIKNACNRQIKNLSKIYKRYLHVDTLGELESICARSAVRNSYEIDIDSIITEPISTDLFDNGYINEEVFKSTRLIARGESFRKVIKSYKETDVVMFLYYLHWVLENEELPDTAIAEKILGDDYFIQRMTNKPLQPDTVVRKFKTMREELKEPLYADLSDY